MNLDYPSFQAGFLEGLQKHAAKYMAKQVRKDILSGRSYEHGYLEGEVEEFLEALRSKNVKDINEEAGDVMYATQMLQHQATGKNFPLLGVDPHIKKFYDRLAVWKKMFASKGIPFHTDYMVNGSNYAKPEKIMKAFALAKHPITMEEAKRLQRQYC